VSVSLAIAGGAAASLIATLPSMSAGQIWDVSLLWFGSILATAVAYGGAMVGAFALPASLPSITDLLLPLLVCVTEFLLFTIMIPQITHAIDVRTLINTWLVLMAVFGFLAELSILRARYYFTSAKAAQVYSDDAPEIVEKYIVRLFRDGLGAGATCFVAALGAAVRMTFLPDWPGFVFPAILVGLLAFGLAGHAETAHMWQRSLTANDQATDANEVPAGDTTTDGGLQHVSPPITDAPPST